MKKLVFLLLMAVVFAGIVSAIDTAHPPGEIAPETVLAEYGVQQDVVTQPAVLVLAMPVTVEPSSFQAVMALYNYEETAIQPQGGAIPVINTGQFGAEPAAETIARTITEADYYLRC